MPPKRFELAAAFAQRFCASPSAYVNPTTLERLNTSARRTMGKNLASGVKQARMVQATHEMLNLSNETMSSASQPRGYAYSAIQNILDVS